MQIILKCWYFTVFSKHTTAYLMLGHCMLVYSDSLFDDCWSRGSWLWRLPKHYELSRFHYYCWVEEFKTWINCNILILLKGAVHQQHLLTMFLREMLSGNFEIDMCISIRTSNQLSFLWRWWWPIWAYNLMN